MLNFPSFFNAQAGAYEIEQSLRFNSDDSAYLTRTVSTNGNRRTFTISFWYKKGKNSRRHAFYGAGDTAVAPGGGFWFRLDTQERLVAQAGGGGTTVGSADLFRDHSAWYHFVCAVDTTQATTTDRIKLYVNGRQISDFDTSFILYPAQNFEYDVNSTNASQQIGRANDSNTFLYYVDGYVAEYHLLDGTQATASDFGEPDNNGVWRPKRYTGSYGTNGFYLTFDPTATNGIGHDHSGNGNNFTPSGFTTSGTGTDVMSDTPTTNWCTLNPLQQSNDTTLSDGNLRFAGSVSKGMICGTQGAASGKYYWEYVVDDSGQDMSAGITDLDRTVLNLGSGGSVPGRNTWSWGLYMYPLNSYIRKVHNTTYTDTSATKVSNGDVIGIAYDAGAGKMWASKNNTWMDSGDPAAGTNELFSGLSGYLAPAIQPPGGGVSTTNTANFGQRSFAYTPPTGFSALNTSNLPAPSIKDGSDYFNTVLWTGDGSGSSRTISGVGFQPGFVWTKSRTETWQHLLYDSVRGAGNESELASSNTAAEGGVNANLYGYLSAFTSDGMTFTSGTDGTADQRGYYNKASQTYVAWNWLAGGSGSSNTAGSITSTVSANPSAGFSIVTYTGNLTSGATVGHGLGVAPNLVILKDRDTVKPWRVFHTATGNTVALRLNDDTSASLETDSSFWNNTTPSSTVITLGNNDSFNANNEKYVAYCFAEVEGYSKISEFTGNGVADGSFVYCGFKPSWILLRRYAASRNWYLYDAARNTFNVVGNVLYPDLPNAEASADALDILSNGFKMRTTNTSTNGSGDKILFVAFAKHPFGGDGVSPATAR